MSLIPPPTEEFSKYALVARYDERKTRLHLIEGLMVAAIREVERMPFIPGDELGELLSDTLHHARRIVENHLKENAEALKKI